MTEFHLMLTNGEQKMLPRKYPKKVLLQVISLRAKHIEPLQQRRLPHLQFHVAA